MAKRTFRRRKFRKTANGGAFGMAKKAFNMALMLKRLLNVETKQRKTDEAILPGRTAITLPLSNIPQGDGDGSRNGDSLKMKGVSVSQVIYPNTAGVTGQNVRFQLWVDKNPGITPSSYTDVNELDTTQDVIIGRKNHDKRMLTKILVDKVYQLESDGNARVDRFYVPIPPQYAHTQFLSATTNAITNAIYATYSSDSVLGNEISVDHRLNYIDN